MNTSRFERAIQNVVRMAVEGAEPDEWAEELRDAKVPASKAKKIVAAVKAAVPLFLVTDGGDDSEDAESDPDELAARIADAADVDETLARGIVDEFFAAAEESAPGDGTWSVRESSGVPVLVLEGTFANFEDEGAAFRQAIRGLRSRGASLLVDASGLVFMQVDLLGELLVDLVARRDAGGDVRFFGLSSSLEELFEKFGVKRRLTLAKTEEEARVGLPPGKSFAPLFSIESERVGSRTVVVLRGAIEDERADELRRELEKIASAASPPVVLDLSETSWISSAALANLVKVSMTLPERSLRIAGAWGPVRTLIEMLGLSAFVELFPTRDAALR